MRILYFDCGMGAAGDMLSAALLDTLDEPQSFVRDFNALGIPDVSLTLEETETAGIRGLRLHVRVKGHEEGPGRPEHVSRVCGHEHRGFEAVMELINGLPLSAAARENARAVYRAIAEAEARVHNRPLSEVHFHELGSLDAVADIVAFCLLIEKLAPDAVYASPVHVGSGCVRCAHGVLPVPAPATAELLRGIPSYGGEITGELCTPTGAALLRHFVKSFGPQPLMSPDAVGYGVGSKVFPRANCVRALLGESGASEETVDEISCNLDDMTGEAIGFAMETLLENGALDVFTVPIGMKKSRPGVKFCCLCRPVDTERLSALMLRHTTSLGVRIAPLRRITLDRGFGAAQTPYGPVRVKTAGGVSKPEYDDLAKIAKAHGLTLAEAAALLKEPSL
ncbi:MAG: nickel pincer cofactor biosynthesis protein LarC [Oscillospiraceae bacterium]|jgi:uncharacterized protein (TIGR00299 family) protein|nr:nickel pincer cofactor biosynthesis protein LarC [Oscillospiraceae bacterium]